MSDTTGSGELTKEDSKAEVLVSQINVTVKDANGGNVHFKIKSQTPLKKLFGAYCTRTGVDPASVVFLYEGERVDPEMTPIQVSVHIMRFLPLLARRH
mmetsp:Transcript_49801/g.128129  ORF Transcript_49801/g.128129 Transcript_49801/m.128129 type:complete len:98 (+) Transcript_49801:1001-1294(+)